MVALGTRQVAFEIGRRQFISALSGAAAFGQSTFAQGAEQTYRLGFVLGRARDFTPNFGRMVARAYLCAKGIRDIASGLFTAMLIAYGSAHALGWFMLIATLIPVADAMIVLRHGGSRAIAFGVHGGTAVAMLIISGLLLIN
jgi:hypothetical protein